MTEAEFLQAVKDNTLSLSFSSLTQLMKSPRDFKNYFTGQSESTPAMQFGTLVHTLTLEPELFHSQYIISPTFDRRTKDGKAAFFEFERASTGKIVVTEADYLTAKAMASEVHKEHGVYFFGEKELKINKEIDGVMFSGRCDVVGEFGVTDLKTSQDANPLAFKRKALYDYHYYMQAVIYEYLTDVPFNIIVVDKTPRVSPPISFSDYWKDIGQVKVKVLINHYKALQASNSNFNEGYGYWYDGGKFLI